MSDVIVKDIKDWIDIETYARMKHWPHALPELREAEATGNKPEIREARTTCESCPTTPPVGWEELPEESQLPEESPLSSLFEYTGNLKRYIGVPCKWGHQWEECNSDLYVTGIGVLTKRQCQECGDRFVPKGKGRPKDELPPKGEAWVSGRSVASHCLICKVASCKKCVLALENDQHSPRKKKQKVRT